MTRGPTPRLGQNEHGTFEAEFVTNNIAIGTHVGSEEEPIVASALLVPTGLSEWCSTIGIAGRLSWSQTGELATESVNIAFQATATPFYDIGSGRKLRFLSQYRGPVVFGNSKTVSMKEYNSIHLDFGQLISINEVVREVQVWQTFLTFALRRASYTDELRLNCLNENNNSFGTALLLPGRKESGASRPRRGGPFFDQAKLGGKIGDYLKAWADRQQQIEIPMLLFSAAYYQAQSYVHANLLSYLQALELLHREFFDAHRFPDEKTRKDTIDSLRKAIPGDLDKELREALSQGIGFIGSLTLLERLRGLYSAYRKSVTPLFPRGDDDMKFLKDARNFLTHYGSPQGLTKEFLISREIAVLTEKTRLFFEICLLGTLGASDDEITNLLSWFEPYSGWQRESHVWPPKSTANNSDS